MSGETDIAVVGAGPYGLALGAHLRRFSIDHRIFGMAMNFWSRHMPTGMLLKSEGFASNLYDPERHFTLRQFCQEHGIDYADLGMPVRLETFCAYGNAFQQRFVPQLEKSMVSLLERSSSGFLVQLSTGERFLARRVVLATGLSHFHYIPGELQDLPDGCVSHSSQYGDLGGFRGASVAVIGAGASAIDIAVLLAESGAKAILIARKALLKLHGKMQLPRPLWSRMRHPLSGIGPGWRSLAYTELPLLFYYLPAKLRTQIVQTHLGPAGGWFMQEGLAKVDVRLGAELRGAEMQAGRVCLKLAAEPGRTSRLCVDHVIAATGYQVDATRLTYLSPELRSKLRLIGKAPALSPFFESSIAGLFFVGAAAANSFGPVMRFAVGAGFSIRRITRVLGKTKH